MADNRGAERDAQQEDRDLLDGVRKGNERDFNALYERYFSRIYNFVFVRIRNHADAEEIAQEVFTVVFRSAEAYSGRSTPLGWIYGIAKNTVYNHLRRARTRGERVEEAGADALQSASPLWRYTPEEQLEMDRYARNLDAQLSSVSDWQAEVFYLRHVENLPISEISRRTDRSSDAIRSGLYRVKRLLVEASEAGAYGEA
ncbi:MAG: RNA polymerase sigma factor [Myxococcota bacterium]|nr:RNA polymerase sigma factor [Myxococcota bacterium]